MEKLDKSDGLKKEISLGAAILFVIGSTIGSGIFMAPQNMAASTSPVVSIVAWIIAAAGSIMIALSFANLAVKFPKTGGCVEYTYAAFGEFPAFSVAWLYWVGQSTGGATLIVGCLRYMSKIFPVIGTNNLLAFVLGVLILVVLIYINIRGIKQGIIVSNITTVCKLLPLLFFVFLAIFNFNPALFHTVSKVSVKTSGNGFSSLPIAIAIAMWSFVGLESATTAGGEIKNGEKNIKKATIFGTLGLVAVYLLVSILSTGVLTQDKLAVSKAPLADMINVMTGGNWGGIFIALAVIVSTIGCANGGIILASRSAFAAAEHKLFPPVFAKVDKKYHTPAASIALSGIVSMVLLSMNYFKGLNAAYQFIMLLATLTALPPYILAAAADIVLTRKQSAKLNLWNFIKNSIVPLLAFAYVLYAMWGTGADAVMWGFILMLGGIPLYLYIRLKTSLEKSDAA